MQTDTDKKTLAALALAGTAALASVDSVDERGGFHSPKQRPHRCHDMKKKRKRRMVKNSRRRNR